MARLIFLGTGNAVADENHANAHLAIVGQERLLLIDCTGDPILRLRRCGVDLVDGLTDVLLTHFHADHVSGLPLMLQTAWLVGRKAPLNLYGLPFTMERMRQLLALFDWPGRQFTYSIDLHTLPESERAPAFACREFSVFTSPTHHSLPSLATRIEFPATRRALVYSSDTAPCDEVVRLAQGVDVLIHEANGLHPTHTTAEQAGEIARRAGAKSLYLIHYPTGNFDPRPLVAEAMRSFSGPVYLAEDFLELEF
jgi:ribonuclease Z